MKAYRTEIAAMLLSIVLLSLLAFSSAALADNGRGSAHGKGFGMPWGPMITERMADRLDLDDVQRQSVDNILDAAKPEVDALREQFRSNRAALATLDTASASYSVDLEKIASDNGRLATEATLLFSRVRTEVSEVLNEEQRARLERGKQRGKNRNRGRSNVESES